MVDEDGNTSEWLIYIVKEGIEQYENILEKYVNLNHNNITISPIIQENDGSAINQLRSI